MANITFANTYSTAGLDVEKISKLKDAINTYIKKLNTQAEKLDTTKNTEWNALVSKAIKGANAVASAKTYITSISTEVKNQIKVFEAFVKALDKLADAYKKNDTCTDLVVQGEITVVRKPVIYLYPEEEMEVEVKLGNEADLLTTYPKYNNGWKVTAHPNGDLYDSNGNYYYSLFWDAKDETGIDLSEGFVVEGEKSAQFVREKLEYMGLNSKEANEFVLYWVDKLERNKYNYIRFRQTEEVNNYMPLNFSKTPDTLIRVIMDFKGLEEKMEVRPQELTKTERKGFVVVEWGGRNI